MPQDEKTKEDVPSYEQNERAKAGPFCEATRKTKDAPFYEATLKTEDVIFCAA